MNLHDAYPVRHHQARMSIGLSYGLGAATFIALTIAILKLGTSRDGRLVVWLFLAMYPVFTVPVLIAFERVCDSLPAIEPVPYWYAGGYRTWRVPLLIGLLPGVLLSIGRFAIKIPGQPSELPLFLSLVATLILILVMARRLSQTLLHLQQNRRADSQIVASISERPSAPGRLLKWSHFAISAALMLAALIPYSPLWSTAPLVGAAVLATSGLMLIVGLLLLVSALTRRRPFAIQMAASFMSAYVAAGSLYGHLIGHLTRKFHESG